MLPQAMRCVIHVCHHSSLVTDHSGVLMNTSLIGQNVRRAVEEALQVARIPGMVVAVARGQAAVEYLALGADAQGHPLDRDSLFPVASITKLATALAVLRLAEDGALTLDDQLSEHLPEALAAQHGVTIRALLCHTGGLPIDVADALAPYAPGLDWPRLRAACLETPLETLPGTRVQYDNVGYGLLAAVVERRTKQGFAEALRDLVLSPLGIEGYLGAEPPRRVATLADVRGRQRDGDLEPF